MKNMPKDQMEWIDHKLSHKQRVLLRAFVINYAIILLYWLCTMSGGFMNFVAMMAKMPPELVYIQMINWMAIWKIAGAVLFLIPGLAIWWERCMIKKDMQ
jgi:hypothetical protein